MFCFVSLVSSVACVVRPVDEPGRACDADHACAGARVCVHQVCVDPGSSPVEDAGKDAGPATSDAGPSDAGPDDAGVPDAGPVDGGACAIECVDRVCGTSLACGQICGITDGCIDGALVDGFDTLTGRWVPFHDAASTVTGSLVSTPALSPSAMKLDYDIKTGGYGGVEQLFNPPQDWRGRTGLGIWVNASPTGHPFRIELYDASAIRFEFSVAANWTGWKLIYAPFSSFARSAFQLYSDGGINPIDLNGMKGMNLSPGLAAGALGSVVVDELAVYTRPDAAALIPLYVYPSPGAWSPVAASKRRNPTVPVLAIINPSSGPGPSVIPDYTNGIRELSDAGVTLLGYVHSGFGTRDAGTLKEEIDQYRVMYPETTGIFIDEMGVTAGTEGYYASLTAYARDAGFTTTFGNPGTQTPSSFSGTVDAVCISEGQGLPPIAQLNQFGAGFSRGELGLLRYGVPDSSPGYVNQARRKVRYLYWSQDPQNPWSTLPPYLDALVESLR